MCFLARIFSVICPPNPTQEINQIRLDVNCTAAGNWCEIDCIKLVGHESHVKVSYKELKNDLNQLIRDDCLSDVTFQLDDGQKISSYRNILSIRCLYFKELFTEYPLNNNQEPIKISNISYEAFNQILHFIFTDAIEPILTYQTCLELMRKADEFYLSPIYNHAFNILKKVINQTNALKLYCESGLFSTSTDDSQQDPILLTDVLDLSIGFIQKNRKTIYESEQMYDLSKDMLLKLVQLVL